MFLAALLATGCIQGLPTGSDMDGGRADVTRHLGDGSLGTPVTVHDAGMESSRSADSSETSSDAGSACASMADGATCGTAPAGTPCQSAPTCQSGVCTQTNVDDGTACGAAPSNDPCGLAPTCMGGECSPNTLPNGTACGAGDGNPCHLSPVCESGTCTTKNASNGTSCGGAVDVCHDPPVCKSGSCQAPVEKANGTSTSSSNPSAMCCNGDNVVANTTSNCGVCGWKCGSGQTCGSIGGVFICEGCTADSECSSDCCSEAPSPNHCSPGDCASGCHDPDVCTGGSHCTTSGAIVHCTY